MALDCVRKQTQPNPRPAQRAGHYIMTIKTLGKFVKNNRGSFAALRMALAADGLVDQDGRFSPRSQNRDLGHPALERDGFGFEQGFDGLEGIEGRG